MNDEDLRDLFAGLALMGFASRGIHMDVINRTAANAYALADAMIEAKYAQPEVGIAAVKKRVKKTDS
jgi:hypothetical protein